MALIAGIITAAVVAHQLFAPASVVVLLGVLVCVTRPVWGVYFTVAIALLGDAGIFPSYPFTKNLSSRESILYLGDGLSLSPLDLLLASLAFGWVINMLATRTWTLYRGRLFMPIAVFTGFLLLGLAWGLGRGGAPRWRTGRSGPCCTCRCCSCSSPTSSTARSSTAG